MISTYSSTDSSFFANKIKNSLGKTKYNFKRFWNKIIKFFGANGRDIPEQDFTWDYEKEKDYLERKRKARIKAMAY
jgi:hypothetical protein